MVSGLFVPCSWCFYFEESHPIAVSEYALRGTTILLITENKLPLGIKLPENLMRIYTG
jgi:SSS family solute:Na+ symporter